MISIPGWPFLVEVTGSVAAARPAELFVAAPKLTDPMVVKRLELSVGLFSRLANIGGLCGTTLSPPKSWARLDPNVAIVSGADMVWQFSSLAVDPRAVAVLMNLLEGCGLGIRAVRLKSGGPDGVSLLSVDDYPALTASLPFALEYEITCRNADIEVVFPAPLDPALRPRVLDAVKTWRLAAFLGGFRIANLPPLASNFLPLGEPEIVLDALSFSLEKSTAHESVYDSLINVLSWMSATITPLEQVALH